jgi:hypothetical protein
MCAVVSGTDPRTIYASFYPDGLNIAPGSPEFFEGYTFFLFADEHRFYIERLDHSFVYFDRLIRDECRDLTSAFKLRIGPPLNTRKFSKQSGAVDF